MFRYRKKRLELTLKGIMVLLNAALDGVGI